MPKKTEKKDIKGKKVTKSSTPNKQKNTKEVKVAKEINETKIVEAPVTKIENKKGDNNSQSNTPFVISICVIVLLVAALILALCMKRVPTTSKGEEIVATIKGKVITADDLYLSLKDIGGKDQLISIIDEYIADKEVTVTKDDEKYVQEIVDYYVDYAESNKTDLETFLTNYVGLSGISNEKEFKEFVLKDYKKTLAVQKYISDEAKKDDLKKYYEENFSDKLTAKHILIEVDSEAEDKDEAEEDAYDKAVKLIQKLNNTDEDDLEKKFDELAKKNSDDTATYSTGGLIEDFSKSDVVKEFYDAAYELKDGEYTSEPVKTTYGYHIILKISSTPKEKYDDIINQVKKGYAEKLLSEDSTLYSQKWAELRDSYKLSIKDDNIKSTYEDSIKPADKKTEN